MNTWARRTLERLHPERRLQGRASVEDALKHVCHENERGGYASVHSLAGALAMRPDRAAALLTRMEEAGLVRSSGEGLSLTESGREYALQVIRAHRLWERYLADRTGVAERAWHEEAERREHALTRPETEELSARLGHPRFDPHGDPIPTAAGELPRQAATPLRDLPAGATARIVHVEDEPPALYAQIVAAGLHAGMMIRVLESTPARLRVQVEGEERSLPPLLATHVSVSAVDESLFEEEARPSARLAGLRPGEQAEILSISRSCRGLERRRLMDLGVVPGTRIEALMRSPSGDPTAYRLRDTTIAIRRQQAEQIRVRPLAAAPEAKA